MYLRTKSYTFYLGNEILKWFFDVQICVSESVFCIKLLTNKVFFAKKWRNCFEANAKIAIFEVGKMFLDVNISTDKILHILFR